MSKYANSWKEVLRNPRDLKSKLRQLLRHYVLTTNSFLNKKSEKNFIRGLYCHYVFDDQADDFENLITMLKNTGTFIDTDTLLNMINGEQPVDGRYFHISFDDGFKNNYTNAANILKKHDVPAIFFVPSSIIGADYKTVQDYCLNTTNYNSPIEMMSWDDLRELLSLGFEVGSHTRTHARFSDISQNIEVMENEIKGSKAELEDNLNYECKYISWPYGTLSDADDTSLEMVKNAGYKACFGAYRGTIDTKTNIFSIPRHHFEVQWPSAHIQYFLRGNMEVK